MDIMCPETAYEPFFAANKVKRRPFIGIFCGRAGLWAPLVNPQREYRWWVLTFVKISAMVTSVSKVIG